MKTRLTLSIIALLASAHLMSATASPASYINNRVAFQGLLHGTNGQAIADGAYTLRFLVKKSANGSAVWQKTVSNVTLRSGVFAVILEGNDDASIPLSASLMDLPSDTPGLSLQIDVQIDLDNNGDFEESFYSIPIAAVPVSMIADRANTALSVADGSITTASLASGSVTNSKIPDLEIELEKLAQSSAVAGQVIQWNGSNWIPVTLPSGLSLGTTAGTAASGDDARFGQLGGRTVATSAPTDGQFLRWNNAATQWEPGTVNLASDSTAGGLKATVGKITLDADGDITNIVADDAATAGTADFALGLGNKTYDSAGLASGNFLKYDGTKWVPADAVVGVSGAGAISATGTTSVTLSVADAGAATAGVVSTGAQTFGGAKTFSTSITVAGGAGAAASAVLGEQSTNGSDAVTIRAPSSLAAGYTLTLPADDGTSNQLLTTDGNGNLTWSTPAAAGVGSVTGASAITIGGTANDPIIGIPNASSSVTGALTNADWTTFNSKVGSVSVAAGPLSVSGTTAITLGIADASDTAAGIVSTGLQTFAGSKVFKDGLKIPGATTGAVTLAVPGSVTSYSLTFPADDGANGQVLVTDGSGTLAWSTPTTGTVTSVSGANGITVATGTTTPVIGITYGTTSGTAAAGDDARFGNALKLQGVDVSNVAPSSAQVLRYNSGTTKWEASPETVYITSVNGLTGVTQTFATGTTGTDFGISSSGTTHTFNLPSASSSNRGLLTSADWTSFNSKVGSVSGTGAVSVAGTTSVTVSVADATAASAGLISTGAQTFGGSKTFSTTLTVAGGAGAAASAVLGEQSTNGSEAVTIRAPASLGANYILTLPGDDGTLNQVLTTDGSGNLTWTTPASAGVSSVTGASAITIGGTAADPIIGIPNASSSVTGALTNADWTTFNSKVSSVSVTAPLTATGTTSVTLGISPATDTAAGIVSTGTQTFSGAKIFKDGLHLPGATSGAVTMAVPTTVTSYTLTYPADDGASGQVLTTDGSGTLTWTAPTTGTVTSVTGANGVTVATGTTTPVIGITYGTAAGTAAAGDDARFGDALKLQGRNVSNAVPGAGQYLMWNSGATQWEPTGLPIATNAGLGVLKATTGKITLDGSGTITAIAADTAATATTADSANGLGGVTYNSGGIASGKVLKYNGTNWVPDTAVLTATGAAPVTVTGTSTITIGVANATATNSGLVSTVMQTFNGVKHFTNAIRLFDNSTTNYIGINTPATVTATYGITFPPAQGATGQVMALNGSGNFEWVTPTTGTVTSVTGTNGITVATGTTTPLIGISYGTGPGTVAQGDDTRFTQLNGRNVSSAAPGGAQVLTWNAGSTQWEPTNLTLASPTTGGIVSTAQQSFAGDKTFNNKVTVANALAANNVLTVKPELRLMDNDTNFVGFKANTALAGDNVWQLPDADGANGQVLKTNGTGVLSWVDNGIASVTGLGPVLITGTGAITVNVKDASDTQVGIMTTTAQTFAGDKLFNNAIGSRTEVRAFDADATNFVGFRSPTTVAANKVWALPAADGTAGQVMKTDAAANLSWVNVINSVSPADSAVTVTGTGTITIGIADGSATQRGVINQAAQTFAGTKTFNNGVSSTAYNFNSARTGYITVSGAGFEALSGGTDFGKALSPGYAYIKNTSTDSSMVHSIMGLPQGATINHFECYLYDNSDTAGYYNTVYLYREDRTTGTSTSVATGNTNAWSASTTPAALTLAPNHVVDNSTYAYFIRYWSNNIGCDTNCRIYSCRVGYSESSL